jgi:hypothetical protein
MMKPTIALFLLCLTFVIACEESPLGGEDRISAGNSSISGRVQLSNNGSPEDVYVWLEGFNIGTRTDTQGNFRMVLPPAQTQGPSAVTGGFDLYYFMGNFDLKRTGVFVRNGGFIYSGEGLNEKGEITQPILLFHNLKISTRVQPTSVNTGNITVTAGKSDFFMRVDVVLQAVQDSVAVYFPGLIKSTFGPLLFRDTVTNDVTVLGSTIAGFVESNRAVIGPAQSVRTMVVPLFPDDLEQGDYEIIPYLLVEDPARPTKLIESLDFVLNDLSQAYLDIPFIREGDQRVFRVAQ